MLDRPDHQQVTDGKSSSQLSWIYHILPFLAFLLLGYLAITAWGKRDFCRGYSEHFAAQAEELRREARNPVLTDVEKRNLLLSAERQEIISNKYARVAEKPWLPYPTAPLITPADEQTANDRVDVIDK